jgi:hypothetical protein
MRIKLEKVLKSGRFVLIVFVIGLLAVVAFAVFRFNQAPDLSSSTVMIIQLDHEETTDRVMQEASRVFIPSDIDKLGTSKFVLYFQNLPGDKQKELDEKLGVSLAAIVKKDFYTDTTDQFLLLIQRQNLKVFGILIAAVFIYKLLVYRKLNLVRLEVLQMLFTDLLLFAWTTGLMLGVISLFGKAGLLFGRTQLLELVAALGMYGLLEVFANLRFKEYREKNTSQTITATIQEFNSQDWPASVFIASLIFILAVLPLIVLAKDAAVSGCLLLILALLSGLFTQLKLKYYLLNFLIGLGNRIRPVRKFKLFQKQW